MDGSIQTYRKNNKRHYYVAYRITDPKSGKKIQKIKRGFKTKDEAKSFLRNIETSIVNGTYVLPEKLTLADYLRQWMEVKVEPNLTQTTIDGYRVNIEKHIIPLLGHIELQKLRAIDIDSFYAHKRKEGRLDGKGGLSPKTILYIHRVLSLALKDAVKKQLIPHNVANNANVPKQQKFKSKVYDKSMVEKLLNTINGTDFEVPIALAVLCGMRRGEIFGLKWENTDLENKQIKICQQLVTTSKGLTITTPKTEKSDRVINVPDIIVTILKSHKVKQATQKLKLGEVYQDEGLVNCKADGSKIHPGSFSKEFSIFLEKNGFEHIRFHDLRHTFASLTLGFGVDLKVTSKMLGHSTVGITADLYTHVLPHLERDVADKFDTAFNKKEKANFPG